MIGSLAKIRVGRVTVNTHFFFGPSFNCSHLFLICFMMCNWSYYLVGHRKKKFKKLWYEKVTFSPKGKFQLLLFSKKEPDKHFRKWIQTWCSKIWNNTSKIFSPYGQQGSWTLQSYTLASGCLHPYVLKCFDAWQI